MKQKEKPMPEVAIAKRVTPRKTVTSRRAVTVVRPSPPAEVLSFDEQILRAAGDKSVDVVKLRELIDLRRQLRLEAAEEAFNEAMVKVQAEIGVVEPDKQNDSTKNWYATLYAVEQRLRKIYGKHGFSLSFDTAESGQDQTVRVIGYLSRGAYTRRYQRDVVWTTKGPKGTDVCTVTHAQAGAETYGKRYLELSAFHITVGEDVAHADADGNVTSDSDALTAAEVEHLRVLLKQANCPEANFLRAAHRDRIEDIPAANYQRCVDLIATYGSRKQ